jgi:hypothetical protein
VAWATRAALAAVLTLSLLALGRPQDGAPSPGESARPQAVPAFRLAPQVVVIPIRGEIDARGIMARSVARRIALAERARADAIVFEIDSPGGEVDSVLRICRAIKSSSISNTVAWINSDAYSGAALVALACREIIINDPVALGDAKPIAGGPLGMPRSVPPDLLRKVLPPLVAEVTESVRRHNDAMGRYEWDEYLAKAIIVDDMQLWAVRHRQTGVMVCIDPDEFRLLFPGQDPGGPTRLASLSGSLRGSQDTPSPAEGIPAGSPKLQAVAKEIEAQTPQGPASPLPTRVSGTWSRRCSTAPGPPCSAAKTWSSSAGWPTPPPSRMAAGTPSPSGPPTTSRASSRPPASAPSTATGPRRWCWS